MQKTILHADEEYEIHWAIKYNSINLLKDQLSFQLNKMFDNVTGAQNPTALTGDRTYPIVES